MMRRQHQAATEPVLRIVESIPEVTVKKRFGILSPDIGRPLLVKRLFRRLGFRRSGAFSFFTRQRPSGVEDSFE